MWGSWNSRAFIKYSHGSSPLKGHEKKKVMKRFEKAMKKIDQERDPVIIAIQDVVFH